MLYICLNTGRYSTVYSSEYWSSFDVFRPVTGRYSMVHQINLPETYVIYNNHLLSSLNIQKEHLKHVIYEALTIQCPPSRLTIN